MLLEGILKHTKASKVMQCIITEKQYNQIITLHDETKKRAPNSQIVGAKENLKLSYGGPIRRQASGTNQRIKATC